MKYYYWNYVTTNLSEKPDVVSLATAMSQMKDYNLLAIKESPTELTRCLDGQWDGQLFRGKSLGDERPETSESLKTLMKGLNRDGYQTLVVWQPDRLPPFWGQLVMHE